MEYRGKKAFRPSSSDSRSVSALLDENRGVFLPGEMATEDGCNSPRKKIEQGTSQSCLKSEYLTLLNSFRVLQDFDYRSPGPLAGGILSCQPPKLFNEKELYGR
jgi:hypothetical protein